MIMSNNRAFNRCGGFSLSKFVLLNRMELSNVVALPRDTQVHNLVSKNISILLYNLKILPLCALIYNVLIIILTCATPLPSRLVVLI